MRTLLGLILALGFCLAAGAAGAANVTGIADGIDEVELFDAPGGGASGIATRGDMRLPVPVLEVSDAYGMVKINVKGADYWVYSDDVVMDQARGVDAGCEPKMAGAMVVHGKRGAGEGCK